MVNEMSNTPVSIDDLLVSPPEPVECNGDELAAWLGLSRVQVNRLAKDGRAVKLGKNRFDLRASILAYLAWLRDQTTPGQSSGDARSRLAAERERLVREQADQVKLKNEKARGELVPAADVEREWANVLRGVRAAMLALPSRVQARLAHLSAEDVSVIEAEVRDALIETSEQTDA